jgi:hypothetical protein
MAIFGAVESLFGSEWRVLSGLPGRWTLFGEGADALLGFG